ncbi:MAG: hypothetical protein AAF703_13915 [Cyanobacteria bacterium P01_D01_bin.105]
MDKRLQTVLRLTFRVAFTASLALTTALAGLTKSAIALPGQTIDEAEAWMQAHPTLRADPRERLSIRRNDTPARRYTFHASIYGPSGSGESSLLVRQRNNELIMVRTEKFTLVDLINGVSIERLEDSLRNLYGANVFADYRRAESVLVYSPGRVEDRGTTRAIRTQVLEGDLYAYVMEIIPNPDGSVHTGSVSVMLKEDVPAMRAAVRDREIDRQEFNDPESVRERLGL